MNKVIKNYLSIFENLNLSNLTKFEDVLDNNVIFIDPFNQIKGTKNFISLFERNLKTIDNPKFIIINVTTFKEIYFVKWKMEFFAFGKNQNIVGLSEIKINQFGLISYHKDYWDSFSEFYIKIPIFGFIFKIFYKLIKFKL